MPRMSKWQVGDVYAPHDLSAVEAGKWRKRKSSQRDVFDILGINPLEEYKVCGSSILWNRSVVNGEERKREGGGLKADVWVTSRISQ